VGEMFHFIVNKWL